MATFRAVITLGSISRDTASSRFSFLAPRARGRRTSLREFTHRDPELVFWIDPSGRLLDAKRSHRANPPRGFEHIVDDEPDYGGFLRGRVARSDEHQLVVVYCRSNALEAAGPAVEQLLTGIDAAPIPVEEDALVISDNADIYGTVADLRARLLTGR
jgi:hypothetical protein